MARVISFGVLVLATSILLVLFYQVVSVFLLPLFLAVVTVLLLRPLQIRATAWCGNRRYLAAVLMTMGVLLAILIPLLAVVSIAGTEAIQLANAMDDDALTARVNRLRTRLDLNFPFVEECRFIETSLKQLRAIAAEGASSVGDPSAMSRVAAEFQTMHASVPDRMPGHPVPSADEVLEALNQANRSIPGTLAHLKALESAIESFQQYKVILAGGEWRLTIKELSYPDRSDLQRFTGSLFSVTTDRLASISGALTVLAARAAFSLMIFVMALFFWFADGPEIVRALRLLSPVEDKYEQQLLSEFETLVRAVVAGSIASAVAQAVLAGLAFWFVGMDSMFLLIAATAVFAMVPFVGASLIWLPVSVWLIFADGRMMAGTALAIYGLIIISTVDNVIRPWILVEKASLHPLAALVGVLGGIQTLGPTGVFVGPIVVAFLQTILTLLHREFSSDPADTTSAAESSRSQPQS
ncbi:MAG: AI-2E family transporter [Planctomycetota bacterium]|jgi:predicted PurR-regulated permease PerM|nr:MAG: AI-2E family transporter [Planctomycetota bacterium]